MKNTSFETLFDFERGEFSDLNWIPLAIRYRLDLSGLKISLTTWQKFPFSERALLLNFSCEDETGRAGWAERLKTAVADSGCQEPATVERWIDHTEAPSDVRTRLMALGGGMGAAEWNRLKPLQRYALCKLAQSRQGDRLFPLAAKEFGLHPGPA